MMGRTLLRVGVAALGLGMAGAAHAADYDGDLPEEGGFNGFLGCLYGRIDGFGVARGESRGGWVVGIALFLLL